MKLRLFARMMRSQRLFLAGMIIVSTLLVIALLAPLLAPPTSGDPYICPYDGPPRGFVVYVYPPPTFPSSKHPFGTLLGYDLYYGCIWGTRIAFYTSILTTLMSLAIGLSIGSVAGYFEGIVDEVLMRFTDAFFALPGLLYVMVVVMALPLQSKLDLGPLHLALNLSHLDRIIIALAIVAWPPYARLLRAEVKKIKPQDFVEAAKAVGCSRLRVLWKHILPNSVAPVLSLAFLNVGGVLIAVSTLSFLGFGPPIGYAEWGLIMAGARSYLIFSTGPSSLYVLVILIPGAFLSSYVIGWSLMGDTLVCMTDPTFRRR